MDDLPDAIGTATEGALYSRAVEEERAAGLVTSKGHFTEGACLNCGTKLIGSHCHSCGQQAHLHRTLGAFMHDLLHGALHFEGRMWQTLPLLIGKPGELTRRYVEGERRKFVSPMALFLFSVFLMFAVFQAVGLTTPTTIDTPDSMQTQLESSTENIREALTAQEARLAEMAQDDPERGALLIKVRENREALEGIERGRDYVQANFSENTFTPSGIDLIDEGLIKKWRENPGLMLYKLQANSYKFSWLLIPLSIPFVWVLFAWKRRFKAYDHAIFVTYSLSAMTLLFVVVSLLTTIQGFGWIAMIGMLLIPPLHIYRQLRGAYGLSRFSALWRLMALSIFIWIVIALFLNLLLVLGAL